MEKGSELGVTTAETTVTTTTTLYYNTSRVWSVNSGTTVTLNNKSAKLADLKVGDAVTITVDDRSVIALSLAAAAGDTPCVS